MAQQPKHQHWVPQFYLRCFSIRGTQESTQAQAWMFSKVPDGGDECLTNVRNLCGRRYLYSPLLVTGERDWGLEEGLSKVESLIAQIWPAVATDYLNLEDEPFRKGIALFAALMHLRNPSVRDQLEKIHGKLIAHLGNGPQGNTSAMRSSGMLFQGKRYEVNLDGWQDFVNYGRNEHDRAFASFIRSEAIGIANLLLGKRWSVVVANRDTFVTSDRPVALVHPSRETYGLATEGAMIAFPLSPTRLLMLDDKFDEPANQYYPLSRARRARSTWSPGRTLLGF